MKPFGQLRQTSDSSSLRGWNMKAVEKANYGRSEEAKEEDAEIEKTDSTTTPTMTNSDTAGPC